VATFPLRAVGHHDQLTLTGHLGELRTRLIVCAVALTMLFAGCLWQSRALLDVLNRPLGTVTTVSGTVAERTAQAPVRAALARSGQAFDQLARSTTLSGADRRAAGAAKADPCHSSRGRPRNSAKAKATVIEVENGSPRPIVIGFLAAGWAHRQRDCAHDQARAQLAEVPGERQPVW